MRAGSATTRFAAGSVAGIAFFAIVTVALPFAQADHVVARDSVSSLVLGPWGWLQTIAFWVVGAATCSLGLALRRHTGARVGPTLLLVAGLLDGVLASFVTGLPGQPLTTGNRVHSLAATGSLGLSVLTMFVLAVTLWASPRWRGCARVSAAWGVATVLAFVGIQIGTGQFGLSERLLLLGVNSWQAAAALAVLTDEWRRSSHGGRPRIHSH